MLLQRKFESMLAKTRWSCAAFIMAAALSSTTLACAQDRSATQILKTMSDFIAGQKNFSITFDTDIEVVTPEFQKIQFASSGQALISRPDKIRVDRIGGYADVEAVSDGKTFTLYGKNANVFAQIPAPKSIEELVDNLRTGASADLPGADLLLSNSYDELMTDVVDARHIGRGVIDGIECEHLAFRAPDADWQIWIEVGDRPVPRKFVITSKGTSQAPQYTMRIKEWKTEAPAAPGAFVFNAKPGAQKVDVTAMGDVNEVPPSAAIGEVK